MVVSGRVLWMDRTYALVGRIKGKMLALAAMVATNGMTLPLRLSPSAWPSPSPSLSPLEALLNGRTSTFSSSSSSVAVPLLATACFGLRSPAMSTSHIMVVAKATRRSPLLYQEFDDYVLIESGKDEQFVSLDELRAKLKDTLDKWPGKSLPPDLSKHDTLEEAVEYLVETACELEVSDGSIQWFQVRLE